MDHDIAPRVLSNREFTGLDEAAIDRLTMNEQEKLTDSPYALATMDEVERDVGAGGTWEQHWITIDRDGSRVYASIYYHGDIGVAVTADGQVVRRFRTDR